MMPAAEKGAAADSTPPRPDAASATSAREQAASGIESAAIYELPPALAEGSLIYRVEPDYPEQARQLEIQGPVVLEVRAARDGSIQEVKLLSGQRLLADAAIAAVKQWRFQPRKVHGQPVEMQTTVTLNFRMPQ